MNRRRVAILAAVLVAAMAILIAVGLAASKDKSPSAGIRGVVGVAGCRPGSPECFFRPGRASQRLLRYSDETLVKTFDSHSDGSFKVGLAPGTYTIKAVEGEGLGSLVPIMVVVRPKHFTSVKIVYDNGIR